MTVFAENKEGCEETVEYYISRIRRDMQRINSLLTNPDKYYGLSHKITEIQEGGE